MNVEKLIDDKAANSARNVAGAFQSEVARTFPEAPALWELISGPVIGPRGLALEKAFLLSFSYLEEELTLPAAVLFVSAAIELEAYHSRKNVLIRCGAAEETDKKLEEALALAASLEASLKEENKALADVKQEHRRLTIICGELRSQGLGLLGLGSMDELG